MSREQALSAVLAWYRDMGVDAATGDAATDWLARGQQGGPGTGYAWPGAGGPAVGRVPGARMSAAAVSAPRPPIAERIATVAPLRPHPAQPGAAPTVPLRPAASAAVRQSAGLPTAAHTDPAVLSARQAARAAPTLAALGEALARFDGCGLKATAKSLCFYRGAEQARVMVIGEAPGSDEDRAGQPFVGPAGQLLDKMLAAIGLDAATAHITNVVYWRPPGNRTPTPQETEACRPFLERQLQLVGPEFLLLLGGSAAKQILGVTDGIMRIRGKWREVEIGGRRLRAMPTLHPAYLLRTPVSKRLAWRDLLAVQAALGGGTPSGSARGEG